MWREVTFLLNKKLIFLLFFLDGRVVYATFVGIYGLLTEKI